MADNKILIVEDSELQLRILHRWVTKNGYIALHASSAAMARTLIASEDIDVVLLDWELPDGTGIDLIKDILVSSPTGWLPIIMVTSHTEPAKIKEAIEAGATDFIRKPAEEVELLARIYSALRIKNLQDKLRDISIRDALTGLFNRRYMDERIDVEFQRCKRHGRQLSMAMIDVDFFKKVNDTYGHDVGDTVLKFVANELGRRLRKSDMLSRYGGEEFVVFLPETSRDNALMVVERMRIEITKMPIDTGDGRQISISFSAGIAGGNLSFFDSPNELLKLADKNLYAAKNAGRNQVVAAEA